MERIEFRSDRGRLHKVEPIAGGGIRVDAALTRVGVFEYRDAAGNVSRELKAPETVFDREALAGLKDAPVTVDHPADFVGPANWKEHAVGHVADLPSRDLSKADTVRSSLAINDGKTIEQIKGGTLKEISLGYFAEIVDEPGTFEGEPYDRVQKNVVYNHVAIGGHDWGRLGPEISLRINRANGVTHCDGAASMVRKESKMTGPFIVSWEDDVFRVNGQAFDMLTDVDAAQERFNESAALMRSRTNSNTQPIVESTINMARDAFDQAARAAKLEKQIEERSNTASIINRADLLVEARSLAPGIATNGRTDREIICDALRSSGFEVNEDADAAYLRGQLDGALATCKSRGDSFMQDLSGLAHRPRANSFDRRMAAAEKRLTDRACNAWKRGSKKGKDD